MFVVLPVKEYSKAKSRLSDVLTLSERETLAQLLFEQTLAVVQSIPSVEPVIVTAEKQALSLARRQGLIHFSEQTSVGLNLALDHVFDRLENSPNTYACILPSDLPCLRVADIAAIAEVNGPMIAPDIKGEGTNSLKFRIRQRPSFQYGVGSALRHKQQFGERMTTLRRRGLAFDLDTPSDLRRLEMTECGPHIAQFLNRIKVAA